MLGAAGTLLLTPSVPEKLGTLRHPSPCPCPCTGVVMVLVVMRTDGGHGDGVTW